MLVLGVAVSVFDVPYKEKVKPIAIACVAGGLVLGTFFCLLYYKICPPPATENEQPNTDPAVILNQRREKAAKINRFMKQRRDQLADVVIQQVTKTRGPKNNNPS